MGKVQQIKKLLRSQQLYSVCEEAACPNLVECFAKGTATFMIMGDLCTRRCPFCDVAHGKPLPLDKQEPEHLASTVSRLKLRYVVITSVDRDDLRDGGARHFADCIKAVRALNPDTRIEVLVPDFRGRQEPAIQALAEDWPDVFNHNLETVPSLYRQARPGASYKGSLELLERFHKQYPSILTKSGLMLGLGEETGEVEAVMRDLRSSGCSMLTLGQYLQPSRDHLPVQRYVTPEEFDQFAESGRTMGFGHVASGPLVRSSYHADTQARELIG
jgi:lipoic acid synthetase